ncbi:hypothetical protein [Nonomuraea sp. NPDC049309]|uniref:hypothetical protein n=1 Tax=Nonomuraea sp. NPDC049309 TaxID=3364350 RepID=UPI00371D265C
MRAGDVVRGPYASFAEPLILRAEHDPARLPPPFVEALLARYARGTGPAEAVTGEVERILGRPARTYAGRVADHAATLGG